MFLDFENQVNYCSSSITEHYKEHTKLEVAEMSENLFLCDCPAAMYTMLRLLTEFMCTKLHKELCNIHLFDGPHIGIPEVHELKILQYFYVHFVDNFCGVLAILRSCSSARVPNRSKKMNNNLRCE